ncbi:MAG: hypothetical protein DHS20C17_22440 [Cyclobacteriaceae bacterium]|nr:MAG: hypothetical protein DHS20C17_22440 [Cyclobacteriaceae bacterium]
MSTSGLFGKIIPLDPVTIIFFRCLMAGFMLTAFLKIRSEFNIQWNRDKKFFLISSILVTLHWVSYFQAIKMAGVALAMLSLFTYPIVTSALEPFFFKTKHSWFELLSSILVLAGLALIVPEFSIGNKAMQGVLLGLFSSVLYAVRNIMNRRKITSYSGVQIMCYQLILSTVLLAPVLFFQFQPIEASTWGNLILLALITTAIAHTLFVKALTNFTASTVSILSCLTPVYGILWAVWLTDEQLTENTIWGGLLIIATTVVQSIKHYQPNVLKNIRSAG